MRKIIFLIGFIFLTSGSVNASEMYQDSTGKWLNSAGGNIYGDSTFNIMADPTFNIMADPSFSLMGDESQTKDW